MRPDEFVEELKRAPFQPMRMHLSDGTTYEIKHPDLIMVGQSKVLLGVPAKGHTSVFERYDVVSLLHVVRLEPIQSSAPAATDGQGPNP